jgi:hypothetical protein
LLTGDGLERVIFIRAGPNGDVINLGVGVRKKNREREEKNNQQCRTAAASHSPPPVFARIRTANFEQQANPSAERGAAQGPRSPRALKNKGTNH